MFNYEYVMCYRKGNTFGHYIITTANFCRYCYILLFRYDATRLLIYPFFSWLSIHSVVPLALFTKIQTAITMLAYT